MESAIPQSFALLVTFIFGLLFGSFATMASYRLPRGEDLVIKPSRCPSCNHRLGFFDLFPVLTWIASRGSCRHCHTRIHWRYPATELAMGILFCVVYLHAGWTLYALSLYMVVLWLVIMTVVDFEHKIIPDLVHIILIPTAFLYHYALNHPWYAVFPGAILGLGTALALRYGFWVWKRREGLGWGDVKFFGVAGMFIGIEGFAPFMLLSGLLGIVIAIFWKKAGKGDEYPFGPAVGMSLLVCVLYHKYIIAFLPAAN